MKALSLALALVAACQPPAPPLPPPGPDATDAAPSPLGAPCEPACAALRAAGCVEGTRADCVKVLADIDRDRLVRTPSGQPLTCAALATVRTPADAKSQGVSCGLP
jgi:hypothetical protein